MACILVLLLLSLATAGLAADCNAASPIVLGKYLPA